VTPAVPFLCKRGVPFQERRCRGRDPGGTSHAAVELGSPEHLLVKTIVIGTDSGEVVLVLMNGDGGISTRQRALGPRSAEPCDSKTAERHTGCVFGGTSPFGTPLPLRVCVEKSIFDLPTVLVSGGRRGHLGEITPRVLRDVLPGAEVAVAVA